jgi:4-aminobutyrate aminotransferase-like enzyme
VTTVSRPARRLLSTSLTAGEQAVPRVVGGSGVWFELADGRRVIDASNTAAPLGHGHPEVVEAMRGAMTGLAVNEGWGWSEREAAAEDLVRIAFGDADWVGAVRFFVSASEANDVALALAQALTGRTELATRERAYHGGAGLARELTVQPQWHGGLAGRAGGSARPPRLATVHALPAPTGARVTGQPDPTAGDEWLAGAEAVLRRSAAVLLDYSQGGTYHSPAYQDRVAALARDAGAIWIADETVTGFGRVGGWFQFEHGESRPDIVTMGKCLAAGGAPAGAVVLSRTLVEQLGDRSWQTYSTFRGHPVSVAAIRAHLRVSQRDGLVRRAFELDGLMLERMAEIAGAHPSVARIDGRGLHWTVELHGPDWRTWAGEEAEPLASQVAARALGAGALIATSGEQTSLFLAPPLIASEGELEQIFEALDHGLELSDALLRGGQVAGS